MSLNLEKAPLLGFVRAENGPGSIHHNLASLAFLASGSDPTIRIRDSSTAPLEVFQLLYWVIRK